MTTTTTIDTMPEARTPKKRKEASAAPKTTSPKRARVDKPQTKKTTTQPAQPATLSAPHEAVISELSTRYNVLSQSVISSSEICRRVARSKDHLRPSSSDENSGSGSKPPIVLLHSRPAETCKLITIVEQTKRALGTPWFQYNQLFEVPADMAKDGGAENKGRGRDVVERTVLDKDQEEEDEEEEEEDDEEYFEAMRDRFEKATGTSEAQKARPTWSMRVFLATAAVPELKARAGVSLQTG